MKTHPRRINRGMGQDEPTRGTQPLMTSKSGPWLRGRTLASKRGRSSRLTVRPRKVLNKNRSSPKLELAETRIKGERKFSFAAKLGLRPPRQCKRCPRNLDLAFRRRRAGAATVRSATADRLRSMKSLAIKRQNPKAEFIKAEILLGQGLKRAQQNAARAARSSRKS